jgi:hypothetical protein
MTDSPEEEAALEADAKAYHADDLVKRLRDYAEQWKVSTFPNIADEAADRIEALEAALRSIAANTCCGKCQEAALVARAALGEKEDG